MTWCEYCIHFTASSADTVLHSSEYQQVRQLPPLRISILLLTSTQYQEATTEGEEFEEYEGAEGEEPAYEEEQ